MNIINQIKTFINVTIKSEIAAKDVGLGTAFQVLRTNAAGTGKEWATLSSADISCRVTHNVDQSIASVGDYVAFNTEIFDTDTMHDNTTNNTRITCKTAGKYLIIGSVTYAANATGTRQLNLQVNRTTTIAVQTVPNLGASVGTQVSISAIYNLSVNDYVELVAAQGSGGALNITAASAYTPIFSVVKIG